MNINSPTAVPVIDGPAPDVVRQAVADFSRLYPSAKVQADEVGEDVWSVSAQYDTKVIDYRDFVRGLDF